MVEISPDAWKKIFFFGFLGNDSLSESQLFAAMRGGGRIFPGGVLGGVWVGQTGLPRETEPCTNPQGYGVRLAVFRIPWGQALGQKVGCSWNEQKGILSSLEPLF